MRNRHVVEYILVTGWNSEIEFIEKVNDLISQGFELHGTTFVRYNQALNKMDYTQPMAKYEYE